MEGKWSIFGNTLMDWGCHPSQLRTILRDNPHVNIITHCPPFNAAMISKDEKYMDGIIIGE